MEYTAELLKPEDDQAWDHLIREHPLSRCVVPMLEEQAGWTSYRIGLYTGRKLAGGLILVVRKIPNLPFFLGRISCTMIGPERHAKMLKVLLGEVDHFAKKHSVIEIELWLRIPANDAVPGFEYHCDISAAVQDLGYRALQKVDRSYLVRIDKDDEALLGSFAGACRSHIRKAVRDGVTVSFATDAGFLEEFYEEYLKTGQRKGFALIKREVLVDGMKPLLMKGHIVLLSEAYAGRIASMAIFDALGIPCSIMRTRTRASVSGEVRGAAQILHYEAMRYLRDHGKTYLDMGGCEGPKPVKGHPNYGVWQFKYGFRGTYVEFLPYYRKARGPMTRGLLNLVHRVRGDYV